MSLLSNASANTDQADLVILSHIETIRDQEQPATANAVASLIGGAPEREIARRLYNLWQMQLVEMQPISPACYMLSEMGAELLRQDLIGWSPSVREEARRQLLLEQATKGMWQDRMR